MGTYLEMIPSEVKKQVEEITKSSGLEYSEDAVELIAEAIEK